MGARDAIVQLSRADAVLMARSLQATQDLLQSTADLVPTAGQVVEERLQQISKVRQLMYRVRDAPSPAEFYPIDIGGSTLLKCETLEVECWNMALERLLGWTVEEAIGTPAWELTGVPRDHAFGLAQKCRADGELQTALQLRSKDHHILPAMIFAQMVYTRCDDRHGAEHILIHFWMT